MPSLCMYFQVHQPYRMREYSVFDIGQNKDYFDSRKNREVCQKVAEKCYLPANTLFLELLKQYPDFKISFSISGVALEQFAEYSPAVLTSFKKLVATGQVEILSETYYHSLAALFDETEFVDQTKQQRKLVKELFGMTPTVFRNTELIYSDTIAKAVKKLGYKGMLTEGADKILGRRNPNHVYASPQGLPLLLKNYQLSDDIAFRFSNQAWKEWPLTADKFAHWVHAAETSAEVINLFMDYETIGEHQWKETGIFEFFRSLPKALSTNPAFDFQTPSEAVARYQPVDTFSTLTPVSWADMERDTSAWLGNDMQDESIKWLYNLGKAVKDSRSRELLHSWRKLQTSDHFYYMCTKYWSDGDVHKYFSAYATPHQAYMIMNNILSDLELRVKKNGPKKIEPTKRQNRQVQA